MAHYAIAFDMDTKAIRAAGLNDSQRTALYQREIPRALALCGFTAHPQGSVYHTESDQNPITAIMTLQGVLKSNAPQFCRFVKRVHVFRMEEWSDVTSLIADHVSGDAVTPDEEFEQQELIQQSMIDDQGNAIPYERAD